jgi:anti-anti-sigma regulatory factor
MDMRVGHAPTSNPWPRRPEATDGVAEDLVSPGVLLGIVNAAGAIDAGTIAPFAREVGRTLAAGATRLLVDLSRAEDVTTAGMNTLLAARQRLFDRGGRIAVVLSPSMRRRFEHLGLGHRFLFADDRLQAARLLGLGDSGSPRTSSPHRHAHAA